ncbi:hypothetical protein L7F22_047224 [Adiantum nelumboides]|nr:hypothetical protein [Adiantum nelumboides]
MGVAKRKWWAPLTKVVRREAGEEDTETTENETYDSNASSTTSQESVQEDLVRLYPDLFGISVGKDVFVHNVDIKEEKEEPKSNKELATVDVRSMLRDDLSEQEKNGYELMFADFPKLFATEYTELQGAKGVKHMIVLKEGATPKVQKLRRLGVIQEKALHEEVTKLLKAGFIVPVKESKWVSLVVIVPEKNGKFRDVFVHNVDIKEEKEEPKSNKELATVDVRSMLRDDLSEQEKNGYELMFADFPKLFATEYTELQGAKGVKHRIVLKEGATPKVQKLRRLGVIQEKALHEEVTKLLKAGYNDSDYARDLDKRRSTSGYVFTLAGGNITWRSQLQDCIMQSTTKAEYVAKNENPVFHLKTKHIDVKYHFIREVLEDKLIQLMEIHNKGNPADLLTKGLPEEGFVQCHELLGIG